MSSDLLNGERLMPDGSQRTYVNGLVTFIAYPAGTTRAQMILPAEVNRIEGIQVKSNKRTTLAPLPTPVPVQTPLPTPTPAPVPIPLPFPNEDDDPEDDDPEDDYPPPITINPIYPIYPTVLKEKTSNMMYILILVLLIIIGLIIYFIFNKKSSAAVKNIASAFGLI